MYPITLGTLLFSLLLAIMGCAPAPQTRKLPKLPAKKVSVVPVETVTPRGSVEESHQAEQEIQIQRDIEVSPVAILEPLVEEVAKEEFSEGFEPVELSLEIHPIEESTPAQIEVVEEEKITAEPQLEPEYFTELVLESHQHEDDKDPEATVHFAIYQEEEKIVSAELSQNHLWESPGTVRVKVSAQANRIGTYDAMDQVLSFGPDRPEVLMKMDKSEYVVVQSRLSDINSDTQQRGVLIVRKSGNEQNWHAHFVLRGTTNLGNERVLLASPQVWFDGPDSNIHRWEFDW